MEHVSVLEGKVSAIDVLVVSTIIIIQHLDAEPIMGLMNIEMVVTLRDVLMDIYLSNVIIRLEHILYAQVADW